MRKFLIKVNGNKYEVEVEELAENKSIPLSATEPIKASPVQKQSESVAKKAPVIREKQAVIGATGSLKILAPMPGTIIKVEANPGDKVKMGQVLVILEAMKMENEIVATSDGIVATINVSAGTSVNAGDLLASLN